LQLPLPLPATARSYERIVFTSFIPALMQHLFFALPKSHILSRQNSYGVNFSDVKGGLAAYDSIPAAGLAQLFFFIGLMELGFSTKQDEIEALCVKVSLSLRFKGLFH